MFNQKRTFIVFLIYCVIMVVGENQNNNNRNTTEKPQLRMRQSKLLQLHEFGRQSNDGSSSGVGVLNEAITITSPPISIQGSAQHQRSGFRHPKGLLFPQPDKEGRCPPGYKMDRRSICREVW